MFYLTFYFILYSFSVVYFNFTLFISGIASFIQVIVLNLHHRADQQMPEWVVFNVLQPLATITFIDVPGFTACRCISKQVRH